MARISCFSAVFRSENMKFETIHRPRKAFPKLNIFYVILIKENGRKAAKISSSWGTLGQHIVTSCICLGWIFIFTLYIYLSPPPHTHNCHARTCLKNISLKWTKTSIKFELSLNHQIPFRPLALYLIRSCVPSYKYHYVLLHRKLVRYILKQYVASLTVLNLTKNPALVAAGEPNPEKWQTNA